MHKVTKKFTLLRACAVAVDITLSVQTAYIYIFIKPTISP